MKKHVALVAPLPLAPHWSSLVPLRQDKPAVHTLPTAVLPGVAVRAIVGMQALESRVICLPRRS